MDRLDLLREEMRALEQGRRYAVVTIAGTEGATSRNSGKMLVFEDGPPVGTVGGGDMEQQAIRDARESLTRGKGGLFTYAVLAGSDGMTCGGKVSVLVEVPEARPLLVLCGGGHVGGAVLKLAAFLGFETILIDDRDETAMGEKIALAGRFIRVKDYRKDLRTLEIPERAYVVLATHSHSTDAVALEAMLDKNTAYLGMLASRRKIQAVFAEMERSGIQKERLRRVATPIGLDLGGETPEEVAFSILAEILSVRYGRPGGAILREMGV